MVWHNNAHANNIPYFASIKASEANIRTGPSVKYPIKWVYTKPHWPIKIHATFEDWRKASDIHGEIGWIHKSLLSPRRFVLIQTDEIQKLYDLPTETSKTNAYVENGMIAELLACKKQWCKVKAKYWKGWIQEKLIWGTLTDETYND